MTLFHLNPITEQVGACHHSSRECPFSNDNHFTSLEAAEQFLDSENFSSELDGAAKAALAKVEETTASPLVNHKVRAMLFPERKFSYNETHLLVLLGKALLLESSTEGSAFVKDEKEKLIGEIADAHFVRRSLSTDEQTILENLLFVQTHWLRNWS